MKTIEFKHFELIEFETKILTKCQHGGKSLKIKTQECNSDTISNHVDVENVAK